MKQVHILLLMCCFLYASLNCKTYDASISFTEINAPIQFGNFHVDQRLDSIKQISGYLEFDLEEETYSENENTSISMSGGEYVSNTIDSTIIQNVNDQRKRLLGDIIIQLILEHGIKPGAFIFGTIAGSITGSESSIGTYTIKRFTQVGTVYELNDSPD